MLQCINLIRGRQRIDLDVTAYREYFGGIICRFNTFYKEIETLIS